MNPIYDQLAKSRFVKRHQTLVELADPIRIDVYTGNFVAYICKYRSLNQTDIAAPKNTYIY
ncbi:MAG: hypothetical protein ACJAYC_000588 [Halieaceae bacterium]